MRRCLIELDILLMLTVKIGLYVLIFEEFIIFSILCRLQYITVL